MKPGARQYDARIIRWVDGDTADVEVDLGFDTHVRIRGRLVTSEGGYYDAPEPRGETRAAGDAATEAARAAAPEGSRTRITSWRGAARGKYGRWLIYVPGVTS